MGKVANAAVVPCIQQLLQKQVFLILLKKVLLTDLPTLSASAKMSCPNLKSVKIGTSIIVYCANRLIIECAAVLHRMNRNKAASQLMLQPGSQMLFRMKYVT